jgi:predicted kinase
MEQKIVMLKGLPASGKTTFAKKLIEDQGFKRINKDDLRAMIDFSKWSKQNEKMIVRVRDQLITMYLDEGYSVVIDDTNFNPIHHVTFKNIAEHYNIPFEVIDDFLEVPVQECIERDLKRGDKSVGRKVIEGMYWKYVQKMPEPILYNESLFDCIICDVDGTLAIKHLGRSPYEGLKAYLDPPRKEIFNLVKKLIDDNTKLIIFSGRENIKEPNSSKTVLDITYDWLNENGFQNIPFELHLRKNGDHRKDYIVKKEMYEEFIKDRYNVLYVIDDRPQVIREWKKMGLTVLDVNKDYSGVDF